MASRPITLEHARLPRGPHQLSREEVEHSQRSRLLIGAAEAVAEKGYASTSVADILSRAGVSRTTFYQLFTDKADCFLAANRMASEVLSSVMADALTALDHERGGRSQLDRLDLVLAAYLRTLDEFPALARVFLVEVYAAGPGAIRQRRDALEGFVDLVEETLSEDPPAGPGARPSNPDPSDPRSDARVVAEVLVAAASSMITNAVGVGDPEHLVDLHQPLMSLTARVLGSR